MCDVGSWNRRKRLCRQTKLLSGSYSNIVLPKRSAAKSTQPAILKDRSLNAFGFSKSRGSKRTHSPVIESTEVGDSEADSDNEVVPLALTTECDLSSAFDSLSTPSKRQKVQEKFAHQTNTPKGPYTDLKEVPSSLPYERYNHRKWSVPDTPGKSLLTPLRSVKLVSPPPSSALLSAQNSRFDECSPFKAAGSAMKTPRRPIRQLHTPPDTKLVPTKDAQQISKASAVRSDADTADDEDGDDDKENKRPPLAEIEPTLVTSSQLTRQFSASPLITRNSPLRNSSTALVKNSSNLSISDSALIWHDAPEFHSQINDTPAKHRPSSSQVAAASAFTQPILRRLYTIEDSQREDDDDDTSVLALTPFQQCAVPQSTPPTGLRKDTSDESSLWNTLLPPGFRASQYEPMTPGLDSLSQTCPLPPPSATQSTPGSSGKRKGMLWKERRQSDDAWKSPSVPRYESSLPLPPLFSLPSTAEE